MVIDCQACGAQQREDDARIAASEGVVACRSCGAQIRVLARPSAIDDDDDDVTLVSSTRPLSRPLPVAAPGVSSFAPIPVPGSDFAPPATTTQRNNALELGALGMSNSKSGNQFDEPTRPRLSTQNAIMDEEPIPLLEADDILDIDDDDPSDAATMPAVPLSSIARPAARSSQATSAPIPLPAQTTPVPQPIPKAPSFLEELPPVPTMDPNSEPTRFSRNTFDHDDLPVAPSAPSFQTPPPAPDFAMPPPFDPPADDFLDNAAR